MPSQIYLASKLTLILILTLKISCQACSNSHIKLPQYLGKGYDIMSGNPLTGGIDPGFQYQIIDFQYSDKKSENGLYLMPDNISYQRGRSCSFKANLQEYKGTQSYQKQLSTLAKASAKGKSYFFKGSFTASFAFEQMENRIQKQNKIVYQASSICTSYKMKLDRYQSYNISKNFFKAAEQAFKYSDWQGFIGQYGTHYVTQVTLGGRAVQETEFDRNSASQLNNQGIDIKAQMQAKFGSHYGVGGQFKYASSTDTSKKIETLQIKSSNYYIGGKPPTNGNIGQWQQEVDNQPMPIHYQVAVLSDIFTFMPGKNDKWKASIIQSFNKGIQKHCIETGCRNVTVDRQLPKKVPILEQTYSKNYGGEGGSAYIFNRRQFGFHITRFYIYYGSVINAIQVQVKGPDDVTQYSPLLFGLHGQYIQSDPLEQGEYITALYVGQTQYISRLGFVGSQGTTFNCEGYDGGTLHKIKVPQGFRVTGFGIRYGWHLDAIKFYFTKHTYGTAHHQSENIQIIHQHKLRRFQDSKL